jgi:hypothetical protein
LPYSIYQRLGNWAFQTTPGRRGRVRVLTVSEIPDFTASGGMIQFVVRNNKVRFEAKLAAADKAGLTPSSQLLKVATAVKKE